MRDNEQDASETMGQGEAILLDPEGEARLLKQSSGPTWGFRALELAAEASLQLFPLEFRGTVDKKQGDAQDESMDGQ